MQKTFCDDCGESILNNEATQKFYVPDEPTSVEIRRIFLIGIYISRAIDSSKMADLCRKCAIRRIQEAVAQLTTDAPNP
jgi:hypothetical protein